MAAARRIRDLLSEGRDVVIEDVRFENEAAFIRGLGGLVVHIERDTGHGDSHASEAGIKFKQGDATIYNSANMTLNGLRQVVLGVAGVETV